MNKPKNPSILYLSTFPPRECGIATFTQDLTNAIDKEFSPELKSKVLAVNENGTSIYNYPRKVVMKINETEIEDYINRVNEINKSTDIKLVNIQHEYGIYGGDWGDYILLFLELIKKPVIITMHTVLPNPSDKLKKLTKTITEKANGIAVMTKSSADLLEKVYNVQPKKISVIPHGVHHIAFPNKAKAKKKLDLSGRIVLSTFGMLNRDKGIEYAIAALKDLVKEYPNILYLIIGATHPVVRRNEGETYRNKLKKEIVKHGLKDNVKFYNKYVTLEELIDFLKATDIYISPTLNPLQAVSGTISYALSCACPIIATKNQYALDVINHERGFLVKFKNSKEIEKALLELLKNKKMTKEMGKNSYFYSRHMTWQNVALAYFNLFNSMAKIMPRDKSKLPPINTNYLGKLTDSFGMIQFANHTKPDTHSGYCLDDNARALIGYCQLYEKHASEKNLKYINQYLNFINFTQKSNGKFHNFVSYKRTFIDTSESEDSFGRAIWALGYLLGSDKIPHDTKKEAQTLFKKTIPWISQLKSLRAISFAIIGLCELAKKEQSEEIISLIKKLSNTLIQEYEKHAQKEGENKWMWFEDCLTYSNSKLPEALYRAYQITANKKYLTIAEESSEFLNDITFEKKEFFSPIGQDGWFFRNEKRAYFDQQPEDTASAVEALVTAYLITNNKSYEQKAKQAFQWFLGKNHLNQMVYDEATGGCYDGLGKYSLNFNQGAESTLSYFLARLAIEKIIN